MTSRLRDRLFHLERATTRSAEGRHLVFQVETSDDVSTEAVVAYLKDRGHAIHETDSILVMRVPAPSADVGGTYIRDLTPGLLTEEARLRADRAVAWPLTASPFTFHLDNAGGRA